jgi:hypothetical protein
MSQKSGIILLTIRGRLSPATLEEARKIHNETAGNPQGVAAAKSLGDLSHNVHVPVADETKATELLILDRWNDPAGLQKFFSNVDVQKGGGMIFANRDPVVWTPAEECASFALPTPAGKGDRFVGTLRVTAKSRAAAAEAFDSVVRSSTNAARKLGQVSHEVFWRMTPPGEAPSLELFALDTWMDGAGMQAFYSDPGHMKPLGAAFAGPPEAGTWKSPPGAWVEW